MSSWLLLGLGLLLGAGSCVRAWRRARSGVAGDVPDATGVLLGLAGLGCLALSLLVDR